MSGFLASPWWTALTAVALVWGLGALIVLLVGGVRTPKSKAVVWAGLLLLLATVILSMLFEELVPQAAGASTARTVATALGMAGFLAATGLLVYGGWRLIRDTFGRLADFGAEQAANRHARVSVGEWLRVWRPGCLWMGGAALLFLRARAVTRRA